MIEIKSKDIGKGVPVVLLHGYLETHSVWESFALHLAKCYRVILIDLPGHGETGLFYGPSTMETMAETVKHVLDSLGIAKCVLIGHSMGGYATLAFLEMYPEMLLGFSLFHSVPFGDAPEKKANRDREIELVKEGKKATLIKVNIPKMFADDNLELLQAEIKQIEEESLKIPDEGIVKALEGMKQRKDRSDVLSNTEIPFLWILGKKDNYIPYETIKQKVKLPKNSFLVTLENSGHCGFIEEPEASLEIVRKFVEECGRRSEQ